MAGNPVQRLNAAGVRQIYGTNKMPFSKALAIDISVEIATAVKGLLKA
ncbi:MAG: hypothetical protein QXF01_00895 [Candidatus Micrarchaeaceae archaeon]